MYDVSWACPKAFSLDNLTPLRAYASFPRASENPTKICVNTKFNLKARKYGLRGWRGLEEKPVFQNAYGTLPREHRAFCICRPHGSTFLSSLVGLAERLFCPIQRTFKACVIMRTFCISSATVAARSAQNEHRLETTACSLASYLLLTSAFESRAVDALTACANLHSKIAKP